MPRLLPVALLLLVVPALPASEPGWAFRPLARPPLPPATAGARLPVDRFLPPPAPEADRCTLARRLYLDLTGLPPSPAELVEFVNDPRPDAYERLIDRLLAAPHFGERWGRHWLDAAGYVDVTGGDNDAATVKLGENKWLFRDWVIRALNEDRPFDQFLTDQIAGDELSDWRHAAEFTPELRDRLIATGFLRVAADDTDENELNTPDIRHGVLQRTVETMASNLFALTVNCAKCHDHKYEPITQQDYYRLIAILQPAFNPANWLQPKQRLLADLPPARKAQWERQNTAIDSQVSGLKSLRSTLERLGLMDIAATLDRKSGELQKQRRAWANLQAVCDAGPPTPTFLLKRGDHHTPGEEVRPGFPHVLCHSSPDLTPVSVPGSSGRRLAFAKWLTAPGTPAEGLVLRVRVNRVWQHLFGVGIVETSDNFGVTGAPPTHPELLDWLATEFRANGLRLKPLIRLLVTSAAYRQSSRPLRRLESESIRDSLLAVGGNLDLRLGGPPVPSDVKPDGSLTVRPGDGQFRRGIYLLARRNYHPTLLGVFDQPTVATNCLARKPSAVVLQSLTMLNDSFVREQSARFAERVRREAGDDPTRQIERAFLVALSRPPRPSEAQWCRDYLRRRDLTGLCHTLLNTSEFLYVP